jgi:nitroreductase
MADEGLAEYLKTRRTIPAAQLGAPGPDAATLRAMLTIATRVPDHGKLAPWRFILFDAKSRPAAIEGLIRIAEKHPDEKERRYRAEKAKGFGDAPLIVCVVSRADPAHPKIPLWEQQLSAGAVCLNLLHAARAQASSISARPKCRRRNATGRMLGRWSASGGGRGEVPTYCWLP